MALILKRLGWAVLALIAITLPAIRIGHAPTPTESDLKHQRLARLRQRRNVTAFLWGALAERDSSSALGLPRARAGVPPVLLRGFGSSARSTQIDSLVNRLWTAIGTTDSSVRVAVVIYDADQYRLAGQTIWHYVGAAITHKGDGLTCVAFMPGAPVPGGTIEVNKYLVSDALAPCAMLAAFGPPGSALRPYVETTRYGGTRSTAWLTRPRDFIDGDGEPPWARDYSWPSGAADPPKSLLLTSGVARSIAEMMAPPYNLGVAALRCVSGILAECRKAALDTAWIEGRTELAPRDLTFSRGLYDAPPVGGNLASRQTASYWFSDMIRDQGREKFARFWKSSGTVDSAFRAAFGEDLGAWTMRWGVRQWENSWEEKYRKQPRILGVTLAPSWLLLVLGWTGIALLGAGWVARKKQVT